MTLRTIISILTPVVAVFCLGLPSDAHGQPDCHKQKLTLHIGKYEIRMTPKSKPVCVERDAAGNIDATIEMDIKIGSDITIGLDAVTINEKPGGTVTIRGVNDTLVDHVEIDVDGTGNEGQVFSFDVRVEGLGYLDPRIRIVDDSDSLLILGRAIREAIDTGKLLSDPTMTDDEMARQLQDLLDSRFGLNSSDALEALRQYESAMGEVGEN